jgi:hypothetical protein
MPKRQDAVFEGVLPSATINLQKGKIIMNNQKIRTTYTISLVILDALLIAVAFILAYQLRRIIPWPEELVNPSPIASYAGLIFRPGCFNHCRPLFLSAVLHSSRRLQSGSILLHVCGRFDRNTDGRGCLYLHF